MQEVQERKMFEFVEPVSTWLGPVASVLPSVPSASGALRGLHAMPTCGCDVSAALGLCLLLVARLGPSGFPSLFAAAFTPQPQQGQQQSQQRLLPGAA